MLKSMQILYIFDHKMILIEEFHDIGQIETTK